MISILLSSLRQPTAQMRTEKQIQRQQSSINGCLMQRTYRKREAVVHRNVYNGFFCSYCHEKIKLNIQF